MINRDRVQSIQAAQDYTNRKKIKIINAKLGNNSGTVEITGTDFWWIRLHSDANQVVRARLVHDLEPTANLDVSVQLITRTGVPYYQVLGRAVFFYPDDPYTNIVGGHHEQHERQDGGEGGPDPVDVFPRMVAPLRAHEQDTPDMTVRVDAGEGAVGSTHLLWLGGNSPTFTAPTNFRKFDLLYLGTDNALHIQTGTEASGWALPPKTALATPGIPIAWILLSPSTTTITESLIYDAGMLRGGVGTPAATTYNLTGTTNQVILSASGTNSLVGSNNIQLSLPQSIDTGATVNFADVIIPFGHGVTWNNIAEPTYIRAANNIVLSSTDMDFFLHGSGAGYPSAWWEILIATFDDSQRLEVDFNAKQGIGAYMRVYAAAGTFTGLRIGDFTVPTAYLDVVGKFLVNSSGNITKINNVATSFPALQGAANTYLKNDGAGNLSWHLSVESIAKSGSAALTGDVTLSEGSNITLTQVGNNIEIASTGGGTPGGLDTEVQFNDGGAFAGDSTFTFNKTSKLLSVNDLGIPTTTSSIGRILQNSNVILHTYNNTANPYNLFIGKGSGNYTLTPSFDYGLIGIGYNALKAVTTGYALVGIGRNALQANTTGDDNVAMGTDALYSNVDGKENFALGANALYSNVSGNDNVGIGLNAGYGLTTSYNVAIGSYSMFATGATTTAYNVAIGFESLKVVTSAQYNVGIGYRNFLGLTSGTDNVAIGALAGVSITNRNNITFIGSNAGYGNNATGGIFIGAYAGFAETGGNTLLVDSIYRSTEAAGRIKSILYGIIASTPDNQTLTVNALLKPQIQSALTNTIQNQVLLEHQSTGTPANGFGSSVVWNLQSSTTVSQSGAKVEVLWNDATHATRKADMVFSAYDTAAREFMRGRGAGSAAYIGFFGATPVAQQAGDIVAGLNNLGLFNTASLKLSGIHFSTAITYISGTGTAGADNTAQTVKTLTLAANTLTQVGDRMRIRAYWTGDTGSPITGSCSIGPAGSEVLVSHTTDSGGANLQLNEVWLHYIDNTHANIIENEAGALGALSAVNVAGFTWNASQAIIFTQDAIVNNHTILYALIVDVFPKGV